MYWKWKRSLITSLAVVSIFTWPALAQNEVLDIKSIEEEAGIMAKVLEESLDNAEIDDWKPTSTWVTASMLGGHALAGSGHIRARYIPAVGVMFTVPVAFPLRSTATFREDEPDAASDQQDLWNKHQKSSSDFSVRFNKLSATTDEDGGVRIISSDPVVIQEIKPSKESKKKSSEKKSVSVSGTTTARPRAPNRGSSS